MQARLKETLRTDGVSVLNLSVDLDVAHILQLRFAADPEVACNPHRGSALALTRKRRLFCLVRGHELCLKLSPSRVEELLRRSRGRRCRPSPDRAEWEWISVPQNQDCIPLVMEAHAYVASLEHSGARLSVSN